MTDRVEFTRQLIKQLSDERERLLSDYDLVKNKYEEQLQQNQVQISTAQSFLNALEGKPAAINRTRDETGKRVWQGIPDAVRELLRERGPMHIAAMLDELTSRGFSVNRQSLTGILLNYKKDFMRTARATYDLRRDLAEGNFEQ